MENASKALIIAGAILLSILIIGIGVYIYNNAAGTIKKANLSSQEISQYNSEFDVYEGTNVSGTQAMALCDTVKQHNLANQTDASKLIKMEYSAADKTANAVQTAWTDGDATTVMATPASVKSLLRSGYTYHISFSYDNTTGYITHVVIAKK